MTGEIAIRAEPVPGSRHPSGVSTGWDGASQLGPVSDLELHHSMEVWRHRVPSPSHPSQTGSSTVLALGSTLKAPLTVSPKLSFLHLDIFLWAPPL